MRGWAIGLLLGISRDDALIEAALVDLQGDLESKFVNDCLMKPFFSLNEYCANIFLRDDGDAEFEIRCV